MRRAFLPLFLLIPLLHAQQDETRVTSPNGQFEFRLFTGQPTGALWPRIGYVVSYKGKPLLTTSWLGIDIRDQEPFLAENPGFMYADKKPNSAVAHYMQNGSLGRRLEVAPLVRSSVVRPPEANFRRFVIGESATRTRAIHTSRAAVSAV